MQPVQIITTPAIRAYGYRRAIAGLMIGLLLGYLASLPAAAVVDERMERACGQWPRYEAEQLTVIVIGGKVYCWNNLHRR